VVANARALDLSAVLSSLPTLQSALDELCAAAHADSDARADLQVVLDEICANVVRHAYPPGAPGALHVTLRHLVNPSDVDADTVPGGSGKGAIEISVTDHGPPFNPLLQPATPLGLSAMDLPLGGHGITLIRQLTDHQTHSYTPEQGNRLTVLKRLN
jgi:anti-sigma regulatory factor (Ser/Thr protein kinase)